VLHVIPLSAKEDPIPQELLEALEKRQTARSEKNWKESDQYRDLILSRGYIIEDTPLGARLKKQRNL
jgi:cysteinyl-tRNA synthetase